MAASKSTSSTVSQPVLTDAATSTVMEMLCEKEVNGAPAAWGRRVARLVGASFSVKMVEDQAKNEGVCGQRRIVIKCAKSTTPPVVVTLEMLARVDEVWGVFLFVDQGAQIWSCPVEIVRRVAYFPACAQSPRAHMTYKGMREGGILIGTLSPQAIASCRVP